MKISQIACLADDCSAGIDQSAEKTNWGKPWFLEKLVMRRRPLIATTTVAFLLFTLCAAAQQVKDATRTGLPDTETPFRGLIDTISPLNGNLHVKIPVLSVPQRGGKEITWFFQYDIESWLVIDDHTVSPPQSFVDLDGGAFTPQGWRLSNNLQWLLD